MKRIIAAVLLLCLSFGYCFLSYSVIKYKNAELEQYINRCEIYISKEAFLESDKTLNEAVQLWNKDKKLYCIFIEGSYCERVSECLELAEQSLDIEEYTDSLNSLSECKIILGHILEKEKLSLQSIF